MLLLNRRLLWLQNITLTNSMLPTTKRPPPSLAGGNDINWSSGRNTRNWLPLGLSVGWWRSWCGLDLVACQVNAGSTLTRLPPGNSSSKSISIRLIGPNWTRFQVLAKRWRGELPSFGKRTGRLKAFSIYRMFPELVIKRWPGSSPT